MEEHLVDFSYLYEVSGMEPQYICDVIDIFFSVMLEGLVKLEDLVKNTEDWDGIHRRAHFLKSSVSIIKVEGMYDRLYTLEKKGKELMDAAEKSEMPDVATARNDMAPVMDELTEIYARAQPMIVAEQEKYKTV